ncbi:MAG: apolipoprotein N-acyltransferase [Clostridia bacterium]|nr:apolipoprotein N-acyltransferase [Clostridia bacterium]
MIIFKKAGAFFIRTAESKRASLLLCFIAGAIGALPYFIDALFILTLVSLVAQFYVAFRQKQLYSRIYKPFFYYFLGLYLPLYSFLSEMYPFDRFGFNASQATFVLICACIGIPMLHACIQATFMLLSKFLKGNVQELFGYSALWVLNEWLLTLGFMAFPWGGVAVSMTGCLPYLQTASLFGKYFITFITAFACVAFAKALIERKAVLSIVASLIIVINTVVGCVLWAIPVKSSESVDVALIQGNVLSNEKWDSENQGTIFSRYTEMASEAAEKGVDIVLLPESAIPNHFVKNGALHRAFAEIASVYDVTLVVGVQYYEPETKESFNAVVAVYPNGSVSDHYDKRHLVPFGEFIPFADVIGRFLPFVAELNQGSSSFTEGTEAVILNTEKAKVAPLVCFDSIFTSYAREGVNGGADILAIVTNDSWFNDSVGVYTHLRHAQLRAIENQRYIIRAANTGVSAYIDAKGQILFKTEPLVCDVAYERVYTVEGRTLYSHIGDIPVTISFIIVLSFVIINIYNTVRSKKNGNH